MSPAPPAAERPDAGKPPPHVPPPHVPPPHVPPPHVPPPHVPPPHVPPPHVPPPHVPPPHVPPPHVPPPHVPPEWRAEFEAAARRPLRERFKYAFIKTYKPVLDDAEYRSWESTADYRRWCNENLPDWLGYHCDDPDAPRPGGGR